MIHMIIYFISLYPTDDLDRSVDEIVYNTIYTYEQQRTTLENLLYEYAMWLKMQKDFLKQEKEALVSIARRQRFIDNVNSNTSYKEELSVSEALAEILVITKFFFKNKFADILLYKSYTSLSKKLNQLKKQSNIEREKITNLLRLAYLNYPDLFLDPYNLGKDYIIIDDQDILFNNEALGIAVSDYVKLLDGYFFLTLALDNPNASPFNEEDFSDGLNSILERAYASSFRLPSGEKATYGISFLSSFYKPTNNCVEYIYYLF